MKLLKVGSLLVTLMMPTMLMADPVANQMTDQLLPEVKALVEFKPLDPSRLEGNLFVLLHGFNHPYDDFEEVSAKVIQHNYDYLLTQYQKGEAIDDKNGFDSMERYLQKESPKGIVEENREGIDFNYLYPNFEYEVKNGVDHLIEHRASLERLIDQNSDALERYRLLGEHSDRFDTILYPGYIGVNQGISYHNHTYVERLNLVTAIYAFEDHDFERGLQLLEATKTVINRTMQEDSNITLVDAMILNSSMQVFDQILEQLLDRGRFDDHWENERVASLFKPYSPTESNVMFRAFKVEALNALHSQYAAYSQLTLEPVKLKLTAEDQYRALKWLEMKIGLTKLQATMLEIIDGWHRFSEKDTYESFALLMKKMKAADDNSREGEKVDYVAIALESVEQPGSKEERYFTEKGITFNALFNHYNPNFEFQALNQNYEEFMQIWAAMEIDPRSQKAIQLIEQSDQSMDFIRVYRQNYFYRMQVPLNYHNLLFLKYRIKRDQIADANIPQFLESMGELAINRITKKPFKWDAEKRMLSTPLPTEGHFRPPTVNCETTHFELSL